MQPVVIKKIEDEYTKYSLNDYIIQKDCTVINDEINEVYELVDGQQRLTTILLILSKCSQKIMPYVIEYSLIRDIDKYYIEKALETIDTWFSSFDLSNIGIMKSYIEQMIHWNLLFIWYEVDKDVNSTEIFTKLNIGKIPLTNAELFKALLLNEDFVDANSETEKMSLNKMSIEWDFVEQSLRDEEFWGFISKNTSEQETRIDFLLKLYALKEKKNKYEKYQHLKEEDQLFPFLLVYEQLRNSNSNKHYLMKEIWEDGIIFLHDLLRGWFDNIESYHYIGFLIQVNGKPTECLIDLINSTNLKKKSEISEIIFNKIRNEFKGIVIDDLYYSNYRDREKIIKVLLFFNIYTMINSKTLTRFSFMQYNRMEWNIEHIHAKKNDQELRDLISIDSRRELLKGLENQFRYIDDEKSALEVVEFIENNLENCNQDEFVEFYCSQIEKYGDFDEDSLGNLTLLDANTNKSYKNALFPVKRKKIIERDKGEIFIPVCTKNVFLKMYSSTTNNTVWSIDDAEDYIKAIKEFLVKEAKVCQ